MTASGLVLAAGPDTFHGNSAGCTPTLAPGGTCLKDVVSPIGATLSPPSIIYPAPSVTTGNFIISEYATASNPIGGAAALSMQVVVTDLSGVAGAVLVETQQTYVREPYYAHVRGTLTFANSCRGAAISASTYIKQTAYLPSAKRAAYGVDYFCSPSGGSKGPFDLRYVSKTASLALAQLFVFGGGSLHGSQEIGTITIDFQAAPEPSPAPLLSERLMLGAIFFLAFNSRYRNERPGPAADRSRN